MYVLCAISPNLSPLINPNRYTIHVYVCVCVYIYIYIYISAHDIIQFVSNFTWSRWELYITVLVIRHPIVWAAAECVCCTRLSIPTQMLSRAFRAIEGQHPRFEGVGASKLPRRFLGLKGLRVQGFSCSRIISYHGNFGPLDYVSGFRTRV